MSFFSDLIGRVHSHHAVEELSMDDERRLRDLGIAPQDLRDAIHSRRSSVWLTPVRRSAKVRIRASRREDGNRLVSVWRASVDATHHFLSRHDLRAIDLEVQQTLPRSPLWLAVDDRDRPLGFMGLSGAHMEALFIDPVFRGMGVGRTLVKHALTMHSWLTTDVNEQNAQAVGFYRHLGFVAVGRSDHDNEGRAYPLLHLRLDRSGAVL